MTGLVAGARAGQESGWQPVYRPPTGGPPQSAPPSELDQDVDLVLAFLNTLDTKVVLALLSGRDATDILDIQRAEHLKVMRELTKRKADGDLADALICDHALFHLEADLRWLELTAARLDQLSQGLASGADGGEA